MLLDVIEIRSFEVVNESDCGGVAVVGISQSGLFSYVLYESTVLISLKTRHDRRM